MLSNKTIFNSLTFRITLALLSMLIIGLSLLAIYMYQTTGELRRTLVYVDAHRLVKGVTFDSDLSALPLNVAGDKVDYTLYSAEGEVLWFSKNLQKPRRLKPEIVASNWYFHLFKNIGRNIGVPVFLSDGNIMMVSMDDAHSRAVLTSLVDLRINRTLWLLVPLCIILALLIVPLLLRWLLRSVKAAAEVAANIKPLGDVQRIPTESLPFEIKPLAEAANRALDKLAFAYAAERQFVSDAAHELRTPLTVIALQLDNLENDRNNRDFSVINHEMNVLQQLLNQLLMLARLEHNGDQINLPESTQVARVLRQVAVAFLPAYELAQRDLQIYIDQAVEKLNLSGSGVHFHEIFANLIENALVHGQGAVRVELKIVLNQVQLIVSDDGACLQNSDYNKLFTRFYKEDNTTQGTGLGLAIVNEIVKKLDGKLLLKTQPFTQFYVCFNLPQEV